MSVAKKLSASHEQFDVIADIFIEEMREKTGCSERFLAEARPNIVRLYRDVEGDALENCLSDIRVLIQQQADTERVCEQARKNAKELERAHEKLDAEIQEVRIQLVEMRNSLQVAAFNMVPFNNIKGRA